MLHEALLLFAAAAPFALLGVAQVSNVKARLALRLAAALAAAIWLGGPAELVMGAGRIVALPAPISILGSALWIALVASAANAMDRAGGPGLSCCAIGLAGLAGMSFFGGASDLGLAALLGAILAVAVAAMRARDARAGAAFALFFGAFAGLVSIAALREAALSPFAPPSFFLPLLADVLLTKARRNAAAPLMFEIGLAAQLKRRHLAWAYWLASTHCMLLGVVAAEAGRRAARADVNTFDDMGAKLNLAASLAPLIAFVVLVLMMFRLSSNVRRFGAAQDAPQ